MQIDTDNIGVQSLRYKQVMPVGMDPTIRLKLPVVLLSSFKRKDVQKGSFIDLYSYYADKYCKDTGGWQRYLKTESM